MSSHAFSRYLFIFACFAHSGIWSEAKRGGRIRISSFRTYGSSQPKLSASTGFVAAMTAGFITSNWGHQASSSNAGCTYEGRYYYFGDRYYPGPAPNRLRCSFTTPDDFPLRYQDTGLQVSELIYECSKTWEECCESGCCNSDAYGWMVTGVVVACLAFLYGAFKLVIYFRIRRLHRQLQKQQDEVLAILMTYALAEAALRTNEEH